MSTASVPRADAWSAALSDLPLGRQVEVAGTAIGLALLRRAAAGGSAPIAARAWLTLPAALRWQWVGQAARSVPDITECADMPPDVTQQPAAKPRAAPPPGTGSTPTTRAGGRRRPPEPRSRRAQ